MDLSRAAGSSPLSPHFFDRIADVPAADWDALAASASVPMQRPFWTLLEAAGINDFTYRYLVLRDGQGRAAAIAAVYGLTTDIAIFATGPLRTALHAVRRIWPGFLKLRMLECGTPVTISSPPFARRPDVDEGAVVAALDAALRSLARRERPFMLVVRDFEPNAQGCLARFQARGYHAIDSLPNTYLKLSWPDFAAYAAAMRSYFRSKLQRHRRRIEGSGVRSSLRRDFAELAEQLCAQWQVVHDSASEFQREVLTPAFYRRMATDLDGRAMVLLFHQGQGQGETQGASQGVAQHDVHGDVHGEDQSGALIAHALLLQDGSTLRWLYVGRAKSQNDGLYLYIAQQVVATGIELGAERIEMGLTTYDIKQDLGAVMTPIQVALRAPRFWIHPFVGLGYAVLNQVPRPSARPVFQERS